MATNLRADFPNFFGPGKLPALEAVILAKMESWPSMIPFLFNEEEMTTDIAQDTTYSGLKNPTERQDGEPVEFQDLKPGFPKTYTAHGYATGYRITKEMVRDGKINLIQRATESFAKGMFEIQELKAAEIFDDGFTTNGYDGAPLFSTQHPLENGDGAFGVNTPSVGSELSLTSYRELRDIMEDLVNENNQRIRYKMRWLLVPHALQDDAQEILKSQYNPENANNAINTVYEHAELVPGGFWNYLDSETAFFGLTDKNLHYLKFRLRQAMEITTDYDKKHFCHEVIADCRFDQGYSSWRGLTGNDGTP